MNRLLHILGPAFLFFLSATVVPGAVVAWGSNAHGQATVPAGLSNVIGMAGGSAFSLALKANRTVIGWGRNIEGQISVPADLENVVAIAAGYQHSLALTSEATPALPPAIALPLIKDGSIEFMVPVLAGRVAVIETSADLGLWIPAHTNTEPGLQFLWSEKIEPQMEHPVLPGFMAMS